MAPARSPRPEAAGTVCVRPQSAQVIVILRADCKRSSHVRVDVDGVDFSGR